MSTSTDHPKQFALLCERRFAPFFWTQFLGAANDNLFKFAFTVNARFMIASSVLAGLLLEAGTSLPQVFLAADLDKAIPIAPQSVDAALYDNAFAEARRVPDDSQLLWIFPEGCLTADGTLQPFKGRIMKIIETRPVPVVPLGLRNLWGSYFSSVEGGRATTRPFRRGLFRPVALVVGEPVVGAAMSPEALQRRVQQLLAA